MDCEHTHPVVIEAEEHRRRWRDVLSRRIPGFDSLRSILDSFLSRGLDGAILEIKDKNTGTSAQFRKFIVSKGQYGVEIRLKINRKFEPKLRELEMFCAQMGVTGRMANSTGAEAKCLVADFGKDLDKAHAVLVHFLADLHGLSPDSRFAVHWENVSPWNEVIDAPGQEPLSDSEGIKLTKDQYRRATGASMRSATLMGLAALAQVFGIAGIIFSLIFHSDPTSTLTAMAGLYFNAPIIGLVSMALILIGFLAIFTDMYWLSPKKNDPGRNILLSKTPKGAFLVFWGRPINWISFAVMVVAMIRWISI